MTSTSENRFLLSQLLSSASVFFLLLVEEGAMVTMALNSSSILSSGLTSADSESVNSITIFVVLLCACVIIGHLLQKSRWVTESIIALIIGLVAGNIILFATGGRRSRVVRFNEELFFVYFLPPIIFNAGFQVKKKQFFRNFLAIILYGILGSLISFLIISLGSFLLFKNLDIDLPDLGGYLALGALFSATDSLCTLQALNQQDTPLLYSLVFGEDVVNDATSVVLFHAVEKLDLSNVTSTDIRQFVENFLGLFLTSTLLGVAVGLLSAYIMKKLYFGRYSWRLHLYLTLYQVNFVVFWFWHSTDREIAVMILMAYFSYMFAELLELSGILTVFFCGILMSHYTWHNVTQNSRITSRHAFATFSFICESFLFLYVGVHAILDVNSWKFAHSSPWTLFCACAILLFLVLLARAAFVFPLSFIANLFRKSESEKIGFKQQFVIWWAGLIRGAVSIALAYKKFTISGRTGLHGNAIMITSTITVVVITNVVGGLLTKPLIRLVLAPHEPASNSVPPESLFSPRTSLPLLSNGQHSDSDTGNPIDSNQSVHHYWRLFDDAFMRPVFGGRGFVPVLPDSPREGGTTVHE